MKALLTLLLVVILVGCASRGLKSEKSDGCCGLTKKQWKQYGERAADAVLNPVAWEKVGSEKPKGVRPTSRSDLFGTTNSPDDVQPVTEVTIHVPIGNSVEDCSHVVVEFSHPDGKINAMYATAISYF